MLWRWKEVVRAGAPEMPVCAAAGPGGASGRRHAWRESQTRHAADATHRPSGTIGLARLLGLILFLAALSTSAQTTQSVTLAWNPSQDTNVAGYFVYYGPASQTYTNKVNAGNATAATITGLVQGTTYYFSVTAYNAFGMESDFSNEASYTVPVPLPMMRIQLVSNFTVIGNVTVGDGGTIDIADTTATNLPARSYLASDTVPVPLPTMRIRLDSNEQVVLTVTGPSGHTYDIQATRDFANWTVIGTVTVGDGGTVDFVDTIATNLPACFYRARESP